MKLLTIIVPDGQGNNLSSIVGAYKIFSKANSKMEISNRSTFISWRFKKG